MQGEGTGLPDPTHPGFMPGAVPEGAAADSLGRLPRTCPPCGITLASHMDYLRHMTTPSHEEQTRKACNALGLERCRQYGDPVAVQRVMSRRFHCHACGSTALCRNFLQHLLSPQHQQAVMSALQGGPSQGGSRTARSSQPPAPAAATTSTAAQVPLPPQQKRASAALQGPRGRGAARGRRGHPDRVAQRGWQERDGRQGQPTQQPRGHTSNPRRQQQWRQEQGHQRWQPLQGGSRPPRVGLAAARPSGGLPPPAQPAGAAYVVSIAPPAAPFSGFGLQWGAPSLQLLAPQEASRTEERGSIAWGAAAGQQAQQVQQAQLSWGQSQGRSWQVAPQAQQQPPWWHEQQQGQTQQAKQQPSSAQQWW